MKFILLFFTGLLFFSSCSKKSESTHPSLQPLTESVYASGTIRSDNEYKVFANTSGLVAEIYVEEGDSISKGQAILKIENDNSSLNAQNSKIALALAQENYKENSPVLKELNLQIQNAQNKFTNDSINFIRYKSLFESQTISASNFEAYKLQYETSANNLKAAKARYNSTRQQLKSELERAENLAQMSSNSRNDAIIASRINGKIFGLYKKAGEMVMMQEPLALIGDDKQYTSELLIDETDISKLRIGQKVLLTLDTYGDKIFEGKLSKIYPLLDARSQTFKVEVEFNNAPEILYPGLSVEGNIIITEKKRALVIPKAYLIEKKYVLDAEGNKIKVETGLQNMEFIEITGGIDSTTTIYKPAIE